MRVLLKELCDKGQWNLFLRQLQCNLLNIAWYAGKRTSRQPLRKGAASEASKAGQGITSHFLN